MKFIKKLNNKLNLFLVGILYAQAIGPGSSYSDSTEVKVGWKIPSLADVLSFLIKMVFVIAGLAALMYLLLGAFAWIISSGDKENVQKARDKIQAALVGLILIVAVLATIITLEQFVFREKLCLGLSCPITIPCLINCP